MQVVGKLTEKWVISFLLQGHFYFKKKVQTAKGKCQGAKKIYSKVGQNIFMERRYGKSATQKDFSAAQKKSHENIRRNNVYELYYRAGNQMYTFEQFVPLFLPFFCCHLYDAARGVDATGVTETQSYQKVPTACKALYRNIAEPQKLTSQNSEQSLTNYFLSEATKSSHHFPKVPICQFVRFR